MQRFWQQTSARQTADGWRVFLDGRRVKTPAGRPLLLPTKRLAEAIAAEWQEATSPVDPASLPLSALANAAIDLVALQRAEMNAAVAGYAATDLTCYRAPAPAGLAAQQAAAWEPPLRAVEQRHEVVFTRTSGVIHVAQPPATMAAIAARVVSCDDFTMAALQQLTTIAGSVVIALAHLDGFLDAKAAFHASAIDENWQMAQWGADHEAQQRQEQRQRDFLAASHFLALLGD